MTIGQLIGLAIVISALAVSIVALPKVITLMTNGKSWWLSRQLNNIHPFVFHALLVATGLVASVFCIESIDNFAKNIGFAFGVWAVGALVNRFGNRTAGLIVAILWSLMSYIGRG